MGVMQRAPSLHLVDIGTSAIFESWFVMSIAIRGWAAATLDHTTSIPHGDSEALESRGEAPVSTELQHRAIRVLQDSVDLGAGLVGGEIDGFVERHRSVAEQFGLAALGIDDHHDRRLRPATSRCGGPIDEGDQGVGHALLGDVCLVPAQGLGPLRVIAPIGGIDDAPKPFPQPSAVDGGKEGAHADAIVVGLEEGDRSRCLLSIRPRRSGLVDPELPNGVAKVLDRLARRQQQQRSLILDRTNPLDRRKVSLLDPAGRKISGHPWMSFQRGSSVDSLSGLTGSHSKLAGNGSGRVATGFGRSQRNQPGLHGGQLASEAGDLIETKRHLLGGQRRTEEHRHADEGKRTKPFGSGVEREGRHRKTL